MPDSERKPVKLPVEVADLPALDPLVVSAVCVEHNHSILQFARTLLEFGWVAEQVTHVAAHWSWAWLAGAVAWERAQRGREPVSATFLDRVKAEPPGQNVPAQPPLPTG